MATREWNLETSEAVRTIRLQHGYWSGRVVITVDGESLFERSFKLCDYGLEHAFTIDGTPCVIRIVPPNCPKLFFSYEFLPNEVLLADSFNRNFERRMRRRAWFSFSIFLIAVYLCSYTVLSFLGSYVPAHSGHLRWDFGLSVTDIRIWHPYAAHWQSYSNSKGEKTTKGDLLGYLYSPLILIDRALIHPTEYYFPTDG